MTRARSCGLILLVLLLVVAVTGPGCKREVDSASTSDSNSGPLRFDAEAFAGERESPRASVTLVDAGDEPREALRYGPRAPDRILELTVFQQSWGDAPMIELRVAWTGLAPELETRRSLFDVLEVRTQHVDVGAGAGARQFEDAVHDRLVAGFDAVAGQATGDAAGLDRVGQTRGIPMQPSVEYMIEIASVPLPEPAIGVGASWTSSRQWDEQVAGVDVTPDGNKPRVETHTFTELTHYQLLDRRGDLLIVDVESTTSPDDPTRAWSSRHGGELQVRLDDPLAQAGDLELVTRMVIPGLEPDPDPEPEPDTDSEPEPEPDPSEIGMRLRLRTATK